MSNHLVQKLIKTLSDDALEIAVASAADAQRLAVHLRQDNAAEEIVAGPRSVTIRFDPREISLDSIRQRMQGLTTAAITNVAPPVLHHVIRVRYGGDAGPDLTEVATHAALSTTGIVNLHTSQTYTVDSIGFLPGFAYLSGLPRALHLPRRSTPRPRLAAGSVAIAGEYCGIYPLPSPGGWHVIGQTDHPLFDTAADAPFTLLPGHTVEFVATWD